MNLFAIFQIPATYFMYGLAALTYLAFGPRSGLNSAIGAGIGHLWWLAVWKTSEVTYPSQDKKPKQGAKWGAAPSLMGKLVGKGPDAPKGPPPTKKFGSLSSGPSFKFTAKDPGAGKYGSSCAGGRCG